MRARRAEDRGMICGSRGVGMEPLDRAKLTELIGVLPPDTPRKREIKRPVNMQAVPGRYNRRAGEAGHFAESLQRNGGGALVRILLVRAAIEVQPEGSALGDVGLPAPGKRRAGDRKA